MSSEPKKVLPPPKRSDPNAGNLRNQEQPLNQDGTPVQKSGNSPIKKVDQNSDRAERVAAGIPDNDEVLSADAMRRVQERREHEAQLRVGSAKQAGQSGADVGERQKPAPNEKTRS